MTGQTWQQVTAQKKVLGYEYDGATSKPITDASKDESSLSIPLILRGQIIGKLKLSALESDRKWTEDELAMAQAAAERTALTLESARLLEEAQRRATRERVIGDISSSISTFSDMEGILRTAVQQLGRRMGGAEVFLELGSDLETENE
jgi:GAF domain-containing protein